MTPVFCVRSVAVRKRISALTAEFTTLILWKERMNTDPKKKKKRLMLALDEMKLSNLFFFPKKLRKELLIHIGRPFFFLPHIYTGAKLTMVTKRTQNWQSLKSWIKMNLDWPGQKINKWYPALNILLYNLFTFLFLVFCNAIIFYIIFFCY